MKKISKTLAFTLFLILSYTQIVQAYYTQEENPIYEIEVISFIDFGTVYFGFEEPITKTVIVKNVGDITISRLTASMIASPPGFPPVSWIVGNFDTPNIQLLESGDYWTFTITMMPTAFFRAGIHYGEILILGPRYPEYHDIIATIETRFEAIDCDLNRAMPRIEATPNHLDFGTFFAGYTQTETRSVAITNTGNVNIHSLTLAPNFDEQNFPYINYFISWFIDWNIDGALSLRSGETATVTFSFPAVYFFMDNVPPGVYRVQLFITHRPYYHHEQLATIEVRFEVVASERYAHPTTSSISLNGEIVSFQAYNIEGSNFFRLRDIAYVLDGTSAQFNVGWDGYNNAIRITKGQSYVSVGGELINTSEGSTLARRTSSSIFLDGEGVEIRAYNIRGNNFFMLRDLAYALGFEVYWDEEARTVLIETEVP